MKIRPVFPTRVSLVLAVLLVSACTAPAPRPVDTDNGAVMERLARMERAMTQLGVTLESLERDLKMVKAPAGASGEARSVADPHYEVRPGFDRDCERTAGGSQRTNPGRSFSTW